MLMRGGVHPGVWHRHRRYVARYSIRGRWVYLGSFASCEEAVRQRQAFARMRPEAKALMMLLPAPERIRTVAMSWLENG